MNKMLTNRLILATANCVQAGMGKPVILIHGLAASLHDWDDLTPDLAAAGYACYALDLLGHGDSPKPDASAYQMEWVFEHFSNWMESLHLTEPAILIGHSLGGYLALEYARCGSAPTRGLVLVDPFYSPLQLPRLLREAYRRTPLGRLAAHRLPEWLVRFAVDVSSLALGHGVGTRHSLPERVRLQTTLDYKRTALGAYHLPNVIPDMTKYLSEIHVPALVLWGDRDPTLAPSSFARLVEALPNAQGASLHAGHVPHQSHAAEFNPMVLRFLNEIKE